MSREAAAVSRHEKERPGGSSPGRPKRESNACDSLILRRPDRNSPRDVRRLALVEAMGAPPPWRRLGDVLTGGAA